MVLEPELREVGEIRLFIPGAACIVFIPGALCKLMLSTTRVTPGVFEIAESKACYS
jgi:hypothetical protein